MVKKNILVGFLFILGLLLFVSPALSAVSNSCVMCHTNESLMKSMHKPPELPKSAGEG